jgi:hypothetical protein
VAALVLAALGYLASLDGNFRVKRSLEIAASRDAVFAAILDFKSWPSWSPWLMHEPDAMIDYSENYQAEGGSYSWDGELIGAGSLTHTRIEPATSIRQQIAFLRPFRSLSEVEWGFETSGDNTRVSWSMNGRMPFLFRFMARRMEPTIARDFDLGLALLNGYMNAATAHPEMTFNGIEELQDFSYWAIPCHGNLRQLEASRRSAIEALQATAAGALGLALTLYHKFDPVGSHYQAEIAIPISDNTPASNYRRREFIGGRYFKMTLLGDLHFLPLGWHALNNHCRLHKFKLDRTRPALEIYHDDVTQSSAVNQFTSALYLPIK